MANTSCGGLGGHCFPTMSGYGTGGSSCHGQGLGHFKAMRTVMISGQ